MQAESGGDPDAQSATSTAAGLFGFTNPTWIEEARKVLPEAEGRTDEEVLALRDDPELQNKVMDNWTEGNIEVLQENNFDPTLANVYTLHFAGRSGGVKLLRADDGEKISELLSQGALDANEGIEFQGRAFADWTVEDFRAWAQEKTGEN